jgi:hypothetical protein
MVRLPLSAEDIAAFAERPHWVVRDGRATHAPIEGGWRAVVTGLQRPTRHSRYHIAIIDRTGATRYARAAPTLVEAVQTAERDIAARNALRLVRPA